MTNMRQFMRIIESTIDDLPTTQHFTQLFHGTSSKHRRSILANGVKSPSRWGSEYVARYIAGQECKEVGGRPLVLCIPITRFNEGLFTIDEEMVEFPIFDNYDLCAYEWDEVEEDGRTPTWQDC